MVGDEVLGFHEFIPGQARHPWPLFDHRSTDDTVDHIQLVDLVVSLEHRMLGEDLQHDASATRERENTTISRNSPSAPHVDLGAVDGGSKKKLGWPIPECNHTVSVVVLATLLVEAREPEIPELEDTSIVDENVGALDVTMYDSFAVQVRQAGQHLLAEGLAMCDGEFVLRL